MSETSYEIPVGGNSHLLRQRMIDFLHAVFVQHQYPSISSDQQLHTASHRVLGLDHGHAMRQLLNLRPGQLANLHRRKIRHAEVPIRLRHANDAVPPEHALHHVLLEALFPHGRVRLDELRVDVVAVDGAILDDAD